MRLQSSVLLLIGLVLAVSGVAAAPASRVIVLVRHGHYAADPQADERLGPGLTAQGVAQAKLTAARLGGLPWRFDAAWVSPLQRARDTAAVIAADVPGIRPVVADALEECTPPTWRTEATVEETEASMAACAERLDAWFKARFRPAEGSEQRELMVCHGNVIRYLVTKALRVDSRAWLEMSFGHASLTTIRIEADGRFKLIAAGDVGHLPPGMLTGATGDPERSLAVP